VIGSWCLLCHDTEGQVSLTALPSWEENFGPGVNSGAEGAILIRETAPALISFIRQTIFDPLGAYSVVNPIQPSIDTKPTKKGAKPQSRVQGLLETPPADEELEAERKARVRAGGLGSMKYVLGMFGSLIPPTVNISPGWRCKEPAPAERIFTGCYRGDLVQFAIVDISSLWGTTTIRRLGVLRVRAAYCASSCVGSTSRCITGKEG